MNCENEFCIYNEEGKCILENIALDIQGNCSECEYVEIKKELLELLKKKQREKNP